MKTYFHVGHDKDQNGMTTIKPSYLTRHKLIRMLADAEELPLHELTAQFQMGRTAVSKHLAILRQADLVTNRKLGRETRV